MAKSIGLLRLKSARVARDFLPPDHRLGSKDEAYEVRRLGWLSECWLGSTTKADNRVGPPEEGLGYLGIVGERITL